MTTMNETLLLIATILMWIAVIVGTYQRIFEMPKWFAKPPASFELIRKQSKKARMFWIPLSASFMISIGVSLILNWNFPEVRNYIMAAMACFGLTGALSGIYFVKEVIAFTKIPVNAPLTTKLQNRINFWLRWTTVRDVLQFFAAIFVTLAYIRLTTNWTMLMV
jgi:uncharacterized iron-regulated membrane protein